MIQSLGVALRTGWKCPGGCNVRPAVGTLTKLYILPPTEFHDQPAESVTHTSSLEAMRIGFLPQHPDGGDGGSAIPGQCHVLEVTRGPGQVQSRVVQVRDKTLRSGFLAPSPWGRKPTSYWTK